MRTLFKILFAFLFFIPLAIFSQESDKFMSKDGTIFLYPKIITPEDKSAFKEIIQTKDESNVGMFDRAAKNGAGDFVYTDAYVFDLNYDDNISAKIRIRKSDYSSKVEAIALAKKYAFIMGQLPFCLRKGVLFVNLMKGDKAWGGSSFDKALSIQIGELSAKYEKDGISEETLAHESCHAAIDPLFYDKEVCKPILTAVQTADNKFISEYAFSNPCREDIAESFVAYLAAVHRVSQIGEVAKKKILEAIPNRIKLFDDQKFDLYPIYPNTKVSNDVVYKIGDKHPDGGIVFEVNKDGKHGRMIQVITSEKFSHDEAKAKVTSLGTGWELPDWQFLQKIYRNVHKKQIVTFPDTYYWSSWRPSKEFAKYVRFHDDGFTYDGPARNKFGICPVKRF